MAFTNRHAPEDTAIKQEAPTENIDVRGLGRYYPEEYSGPIHAAQNRGQIIADVPKTLAGIVLNHNDHAISTWQAEQEVQLQDKRFVNKLLLDNRQQQMELATDVELFDARKDLENQIFQARKKVALEGGMNSEAAVNEVIENFKDRFQGRLIPDRKWQSILNELGLRSAAQARAEDVQTGILTNQNAILNQFNVIHDSVIGMQQNPDGTFQPMMDIKTGMDLFVKNISPLIQHIDAADRPKLLQQCFNALVLDQAKALVELYQKGQLSADTLMTQLQGLKETYGGATHSWTFIDENGDPLKDTDNKNLTVDLTLDSATDLFLIQAFRDAKGGIGNGGEQIADTALSDFKDALGYDDIQKQGWSKDLLTLNTDSLRNLLTGSIANVINGTASDSKKLTTIRDLMKVAKDAYMLLYAKKLVNDLGPDALEGIRQLTRDIDNAYAHNRSNMSWEDFKAPIVIGDKTYYPNPSIITDQLKMDLANIGVDMNLIAPKLGDSDEEAAQYWKSCSELLHKYADAMSNNDMSDLLYTTDGTVRGSIDNIVSYFTPDQLFDSNKSGAVLKDTSAISKDLGINLRIIKEANERNGSSRYIPATAMDSILGNINKLPTIAEQMEAKKFLISTLNDTGMASDIYAYSEECLRQQKDDGGLLSLDALLNSKEGYDAYKTALNNNVYKIDLKPNDTTDIKARARLIRNDLNIPMQDWNAYEKLEQWCMLAAYDPASKEIDTNSFEKYYREALNNQYIQFKKSNIFGTNSIYKNHPAIVPYKNNMNRLQDIGDAYKSEIKNVPNYIKPIFQDLLFTPGMDGNWYLTINGETPTSEETKTGRIFDNSILFNVATPEEIAKVSVGLLSSKYAINKFSEYQKEAKSLNLKTQFLTNLYDDPYTTDKEQYEKRHAARIALGKNPNKVYLTILNYHLKKNKNEGDIKNIQQLMKYEVSDPKHNIGE